MANDFSKQLDSQLGEYADDELVRTISADGSLAVRAVVSRNLVAEAAERRALAPTALNALGRLLTGAVLLGTGNKEGEKVQVQLRGDGPLAMMLAICDSTGRVRGTVQNPAIDLPLRGGHPDVAGAIGLGTLTVIRSHPSWQQPYSGTVPLVSGGVAGDLTLYLTESEQTPSAVGLGVAIGADGRVSAAGGFLVQSLPDAADDALQRMEANVLSLPNGPNVEELAGVNVARISVGTAFFNVAMNALATAAREWRDEGTHGFWPAAIGGMVATKDAFE